MTVTTNNVKAPATRQASARIAAAKAAKAKAKGPKAPTKAEMERRKHERAMASADKKVAASSIETARKLYADGELKVDGLRNVYAIHLNNTFGFMLKEHKVHWSAIYESKNARHPESNMRPLWNMIEAERVALDMFLKDKHSNPAQVWKRTKERAFQIAYPGQKRPPRNSGKLPSVRAVELAISAYKAVAKETIQSAEDEKIVRILGEALIALRVDLQKINEKLG